MKKIKKLLRSIAMLPEKLVLTLYKYYKKIRKDFRRRQHLKHQKTVYEAAGMLVSTLEPLMIHILNEAVKNYHENMQQNHHTVQAQKDIQKFFEIEIKRFITCQK